MKLIHGDCIEEMDKLIEQGVKVDAVITDPPYGMSYQSNFRTNKFETILQDKNVDVQWLKIADKLLKENSAIYMCTRWDVYNKWYTEVEKHYKIKNAIIWNKPGGSIGDLKGSYMYNYEMIIFAVKGRHILRGKRQSDVMTYYKGNTSKYQHPTQKPVALMEKLILSSTDKGDTVIDPFMGSGSTGVACKNTNRNFIGIELDQNYFEIAKKRINETTSLFV